MVCFTAETIQEAREVGLSVVDQRLANDRPLSVLWLNAESKELLCESYGSCLKQLIRLEQYNETQQEHISHLIDRMKLFVRQGRIAASTFADTLMNQFAEVWRWKPDGGDDILIVFEGIPEPSKDDLYFSYKSNWWNLRTNIFFLTTSTDSAKAVSLQTLDSDKEPSSHKADCIKRSSEMITKPEDRSACKKQKLT